MEMVKTMMVVDGLVDCYVNFDEVRKLVCVFMVLGVTEWEHI